MVVVVVVVVDINSLSISIEKRNKKKIEMSGCGRGLCCIRDIQLCCPEFPLANRTEENHSHPSHNLAPQLAFQLAGVKQRALPAKDWEDSMVHETSESYQLKVEQPTW